MITWRWVGEAPACCTMASVMARTSAFFCDGVRPVHICTVTTGISRLLPQYYFDPLADATPLTGADRNRRAAAKPASPDRLQSEPLGRVEIDAARRCCEIDDEGRFRQPREHVLADHAGRNRGENKIEIRRQRRQLVQLVRRCAGHISSGTLLWIARRDMGMRAERHKIAR